MVEITLVAQLNINFTGRWVIIIRGDFIKSERERLHDGERWDQMKILWAPATEKKWTW